jgi:hypothetical protein
MPPISHVPLDRYHTFISYIHRIFIHLAIPSLMTWVSNNAPCLPPSANKAHRCDLRLTMLHGLLFSLATSLPRHRSRLRIPVHIDFVSCHAAVACRRPSCALAYISRNHQMHSLFRPPQPNPTTRWSHPLATRVYQYLDLQAPYSPYKSRELLSG